MVKAVVYLNPVVKGSAAIPSPLGVIIIPGVKENPVWLGLVVRRD